jgi:hypothetical protein
VAKIIQNQTSCPSLGKATDVGGIICGPCLHSFCVTEMKREIKTIGAEVVVGEISAQWHAIIIVRLLC